MFPGVLEESISGRAMERGVFQVFFHPLRDFAKDKHRTVDDIPYGGGAGMVMRCEPLYNAWQAAKNRNPGLPARTILLSPQGPTLTQAALAGYAERAASERLILVCGRYEGVDERFIELCVDEELSLGDFVLSGGEIAALALIDGIMRLLPGALGNAESLQQESFSPANQGLLEAPHYTRPPEFMGKTVPEALLSGNHKEIQRWRAAQALSRTRTKRPDLLKKQGS